MGTSDFGHFLMENLSRKNPWFVHTMGDTTCILPRKVTKIILARQWASWVSRDQTFNVEYKCIGFLLDGMVWFI